MKRVKVCPHIDRHGRSCPHLMPCEKHARPANATWSPNRDRQAQHRFRTAVLERDRYTCQRCGETRDLVAHHVLPGDDPSAGVTLCRPCHRIVDANAR